jgi:hypothetical protein
MLHRVLPRPQEGPVPIYEIIESYNSTTISTPLLTKTELHHITHIDYGQFGPSIYKILGPSLV